MYNRHKLSLAFLTVQGCSPVEMIKSAAAAGYDAAGLRLSPPLGLELAYPILGDRPLIREIKQTAGDLGISLYDGELLTLLPENDLDHWHRVVDTSAELGIPVLQVHGEDPAFDRMAESLAMLCDLAADAGITVAIEFMRWRVTATIEDAARLAKASRRNNVGILLDALHLSRSGGSPQAVAAISADLITYMQLCDAPAVLPADNAACIDEARNNRLMPGEGGLWLRELMAILPKDITISIETPHRGDSGLSFVEKARKSLDTTRSFLASIEG